MYRTLGLLGLSVCAYLVLNAVPKIIGLEISLLFAIFSFIFFAILTSGFYQARTFGGLIFPIVLWIGIWLKLVIHWAYPALIWTEPIGAFDGSKDSWADVLLIASVGGAGVFIAQWVFKIAARRFSMNPVSYQVPSWYRGGMRTSLWLGAILVVASTLFLNEYFHIIHLGRPSAIDLPWPWQGLFGWWCNIGMLLLILTLFGLDASIKALLWLGIGVLVLATLGISISMHSRGVYVFGILPFAYALWKWNESGRHFSKLKLIVLAGTFMLGAVLSIGVSEYRRYAGPDGLPLNGGGHHHVVAAKSSPSKPEINLPEVNVLERLPGLAVRLMVDRWLGLEGMMAISAFPGKSTALFFRAIKERRTKDRADFYTSQISGSGFKDSDTTKYQYATMPGAIGYLYLSGSLWVVFSGMFMLSMLLFLSEAVIYKLSGNLFLSASVGMYVVLLIVQLGAGGLVQPMTSYVTTMAASILLALIFRGRFVSNQTIR